MLPKKKRISRAMFPQSRGTRAVFEFGSIEFFPKLPSSGAVIAPKKIFKTSVARHKVKRKIQPALVRALQGKDRGAVIVRPNLKALTAPGRALQAAFEKAFRASAR